MFEKVTTDALKRLRPLLEAGDMRALASFELANTGQYRDLIASQMREAYEFGKKGAADEMKVAATPTRRNSLTLINQLANTITDKQMSDLLFLVRAEVLKDVRKYQLSDDEEDQADESTFIEAVIARLVTAFADFFDSKVALTGSLSVMQAFTRGRDDTFIANTKSIYAMQWSAVLDSRTCPVCLDLDGSVFSQGDNTWEPPVHFNCRCIKVAIMSDEVDPPAMTGFPENPGGMENQSV